MPASLGVISGQTLLITARHAGQWLTVDDTVYIAPADGAEIRVYGTGIITVGPGWWDKHGIYDGEYVGPWIAASEPVGDMVTYTVHAYDSNGTLLDDGGTVTIPPVTIGHSEAWICDPHDPMASELVGLYDTGGDETSEAAVEELVTLLGMPIGRGQARQRRQRTWRIGSVRPLAVDAILGTGTATGGTGTWSVMVRADPDCITHPTGVLHVTAPTVARHQLRPHDPDTRWTWPGTETRGPQAPPAVARRTYADDLDETPTYADSLAMYPTYRDRIQAGL